MAFWQHGSAAMLLVATVAVVAPVAPGEGARVAKVDPVKSQLVARINAFTEKDRTADPKQDLTDQLAIEAEVKRNGKVPELDQATLLSNIGGSYFYLKDYGRAIDYMERSAALMTKAGAAPADIAGAHNNLAAILASQNQLDEAERHHREALTIRRKLEGPRGPSVASSLFGLGYVLFRKGRIEEGMELIRDGVMQQLEFGKPKDPLTVMRLASLGSVQSAAGLQDEAIETNRRALKLGRDTLGAEHPVTGIAMNNLGTALIATGQYGDAVPVLRETLRVRELKDGRTSPGVVYALRNLSSALAALGQFDEAETLALHAAKVWIDTKETENPGALSTIWASAASLAARRGDYDAERDRMALALADALARLKPDNVQLALIRAQEARRLHDGGDDKAAAAMIALALPPIRANLRPDHYERLTAEIVEGQIVAANGDVAGGFATADDARRRLQAALLNRSSSQHDIAIGAGASADGLARFIELALMAKQEDAAFAAAQLFNLTDIAIAQADAGRRLADDTGAAGEAARELQRIARQARQLRLQHAKAIEARNAAEVARLQQALDDNAVDFAKRDADFRARFPALQAFGRVEPVALADYRARMRPDETLVVPIAGNRHWLSLKVSRDAVRWSRSRESGSALAGDAAAVRRSVDSGGAVAFPHAAARRLFVGLFPDGLPSGRALVQYGGGPLASLPLGLMLTRDWRPGQGRTPWLIRDRSVRVTVNLAPAPERRVETAGFVGIGAPVLSGSGEDRVRSASLFRSGKAEVSAIAQLPSLPNAAKELGAMRAALDPEGRIFVGDGAREPAIRGADLRHAAVIAFATHGLVSGELRGLGEPALVLTPPVEATAGDDGLLTASEIADLDLSADWIILSACNTAGGGADGAPMFSGLAQAFAQAGARALLLSHWRVRDDVAARLAVGTVREAARGVDRAEALRRAQLELIDDRRVPGADHPAVWAPFVLVAR